MEGDEKNELRKRGEQTGSETTESDGVSLQSVREMFRRQQSFDAKYTWDYCMVFNREMDDMELSKHYSVETRKVINSIKASGLQTTEYLSVQKDEVYCLIGATNKRLTQEADRIEYDLVLDPDKALKTGIDLKLDLALRTIENDEKSRYCKEDSWKNIYCKYDKTPEAQEIYQKYDDEGSQHMNTLFKTSDRLKLTISIIEAEKDFGGAGLAVGKMISRVSQHPLLACFPLHQNEKMQQLEDEWSLFFQPLNKVQAYFGEYFALYFAFLQFYNISLVFPAVVGLYYFYKQYMHGSPDVSGLFLLGIFISVWCACFMEFWKQRESTLRTEWGQTNFLVKEQPRPEFEGELIFSPIDGTLVEYFPWHQRFLRVMFSHLIVFTMICGVVVCVMSIFWVQKLWRNWEYGPILVGILSSIQIMGGNALYAMVSEKLTIQENHQTDSEYENALIGKTFMFKFVNSYNSLFYIAFFKKYHMGCPNEHGDVVISGQLDEGEAEGSCLGELQIQLGTIFISMIVINNALEWFVPVLTTKYESNKQASTDKSIQKTPAELQFELADNSSTFSEYDELVLQFGYVTMFIIAFPLTPLLAIMNNIIEVWLDSRKLTRNSRRPEPRGAYTIGTWRAILEVLTIFTVLTNVGLAVFETKTLARASNLDVEAGEDYTLSAKFWMFFVSEHLILVIRQLIKYFIPDETEEVTYHLRRQVHVGGALIHKIKNPNKVIPNTEQEVDSSKVEMRYDNLEVGYEPTEHHFEWHEELHKKNM